MVVAYFAAFEMFEICSQVYKIENTARTKLPNQVAVECGNIEGNYSKEDCVELKNVEAPSDCKLINNYTHNNALEQFTLNFTIQVESPKGKLGN